MICQSLWETIHKHLDEVPDDWQARRELADLLEEDGKDSAVDAQRWMILHKRCPEHWTRVVDLTSGRLPRWDWFQDDSHMPQTENSTLPKQIYRNLSSNGIYNSRQEAELNLEHVLEMYPYLLKED